MRGGVQLCGDSLRTRYYSSGSHFGSSVLLTPSVALGKIFCTQTKPRERFISFLQVQQGTQRFRALNLPPSLGLGGHGTMEFVNPNSSFWGKDWCYPQQCAGRNRKPPLGHPCSQLPLKKYQVQGSPPNYPGGNPEHTAELPILEGISSE